jgi:hypothetical protein
MPQRAEVTKALRFFKQNPRIPARGIQYIANKLHETEEESGQTQAYLRSAYHYLRRKHQYPVKHPMLRNINRLATELRGKDASD